MGKGRGSLTCLGEDLWENTLRGYDEVDGNPTLDPTTWLYALFVWISMFVLMVGLMVASASTSASLPPVVGRGSASRDFSEVRAMDHVKTMMERAKANETAPISSYVYETLSKMCGDVDDWGENSCTNSRDNMERGLPTMELYRKDYLDLSYLDDEGVAHQMESTQPIAMRVSNGGFGNYTQNAVLVSCRYNPALGNADSMNDPIAAAVMIEMIRALQNVPLQDKPLLAQAIIFNFADSRGTDPTMGAKSFMYFNNWADTVRAVVNLDSFTAEGGKEAIFQYGPNNPWLVDLYAAVAPHPHANAMTRDFLETDDYPYHDTDFDTYTCNGNDPRLAGCYQVSSDLQPVGLSFAWYQNGYTYDTTSGSAEDRVDKILEGSLQHMGENVMAYARELAYSSLLADHSEFAEADSVYYDLLGSTMVSYNTDAGLIAYTMVMLASFMTMVIRKEVRKKGKMATILALSTGVAVSWGIGFSVALLVAAVCASFASMAWFSMPVLSVAMYGFPAAFGMVLVQWLVAEFWCKRRLEMSHGQVGRDCYKAITFLWTFVLMAMIGTGVASTFLPFWWTLWMAVAFGITQAVRATVKKGKKFKEGEENAKQIFISTFEEEEEEEDESDSYKKFSDLWLLNFLGAFMFPTIVAFDGFLMLLRATMPVSGYLGALHGGEISVLAADLNVVILVSLCTLMLLTVCLPFLHRAGHIGKLCAVLGCSTLLVFVIAAGVGASGTEIFDAEHPKRVFVDQHHDLEHCIVRESGGALTLADRPPNARADVLASNAYIDVSSIDAAKSLDDVLADVSGFSFSSADGDYHATHRTEFDNSDMLDWLPVLNVEVEVKGVFAIVYVDTSSEFYGPPEHIKIKAKNGLTAYPAFTQDTSAWIDSEEGQTLYETDYVGSMEPGFRFDMYLEPREGQEVDLEMEFTSYYYYADSVLDGLIAQLPDWVASRKSIAITQKFTIKPKFGSCDA